MSDNLIFSSRIRQKLDTKIVPGISSSLVSDESDGAVSASFEISSSDESDESGCVELARSVTYENGPKQLTLQL